MSGFFARVCRMGKVRRFLPEGYRLQTIRPESVFIARLELEADLVGPEALETGQ